jgi:ABC-type glutathione transport system ATPase component
MSLNIVVERGQTVAIVGESGSGKIAHRWARAARLRQNGSRRCRSMSACLLRTLRAVRHRSQAASASGWPSRALAVKPRILVCDEPVSALDVSVQAQVLNLVKRLQVDHGLSYLFITHDLAVIRQIAERIYVLYRGEIVEERLTERVIGTPQHPYTRRLIESTPGLASQCTT